MLNVAILEWIVPLRRIGSSRYYLKLIALDQGSNYSRHSVFLIIDDSSIIISTITGVEVFDETTITSITSILA